jgi:hypothetical protein
MVLMMNTTTNGTEILTRPATDARDCFRLRINVTGAVLGTAIVVDVAGAGFVVRVTDHVYARRAGDTCERAQYTYSKRAIRRFRDEAKAIAYAESVRDAAVTMIESIATR